MNLPEKVARKLRDLPDAPGCYLMRDRQGRIIYVGKAASLRRRVQSYFRHGTLRRASPKLRSLVHSVADLDLIVVGSEAEAILTEGRLIKDYRPRFNVSFKDDKRFLLLRADPREPFPAFSLCRIQRADGRFYFGPYASAASARAAQDFVEKRFGLRKCPPRVPDEETYRHCLNDIIRFCSAPCVGRVSREAYHAGFQEAVAFLRGERPAVLRELRDAMRGAAAAMDFEQAAALRDTWRLLDGAVRRKTRMAATPDRVHREAEAGLGGLQAALRLARPPRVIEGFDISTISGTHAVGSMVCAVDGLPQRNRYRRFRIRSVEGQDDPAMMAEVIRRRYARLQVEGGTIPDLILVDGGITQQHAAQAELAALGLAHLPVAGLAKRYEELYEPAGRRPLRLPKDSPALYVLQRLRDEAHRFALTYHRQLRSRRMRESVLDEIPKVGEKRKQQLLAHFGSVRRLAHASCADIAALPGFGLGTAGVVHAWLHKEFGRETCES